MKHFRPAMSRLMHRYSNYFHLLSLAGGLQTTVWIERMRLLWHHIKAQYNQTMIKPLYCYRTLLFLTKKFEIFMFQTWNIILITTKLSKCKLTDCLRPSLLPRGKGYINPTFRISNKSLCEQPSRTDCVWLPRFDCKSKVTWSDLAVLGFFTNAGTCPP